MSIDEAADLHELAFFWDAETAQRTDGDACR